LTDSYKFFNPVQINFGTSIRKGLLEEVSGKKCLIVCSKRGREHFTNDPILGLISTDTNNIWVDDVKESPTIEDIQVQLYKIRDYTFDIIIAFGGGSVIDSGKAISVSKNILNDEISIMDIIDQPNQLSLVDAIPLYALPTTSGTGAEMTPFATFWDKKNKKKYSLDHQKAYPYASYIDPDLTVALPKLITLSTGLDAINQAFESIWNINASEYTLNIAYRSIALGIKALPLIINMDNNNARKDLAECSMLAGIAISQTRTAMCHSISYPLTSHFNVPHGIACAFTMREILKINIKNDDGRLNALAKRLMGDGKSSEDLIHFFEEFYFNLDILNIFKSYINNINSIKDIKNEMFTKARAKNSFVKITMDDMDSILENSFNK
jgi:alcohol dehydrogenase